MAPRGELRIDPGALFPPADTAPIELAVLYTERKVSEALLHRAVMLTAGLDARVLLVAVHTIPFPADFECSTATHAYLVQALMELADQCALPVRPLVVLARSREEGFLFALQPESIVLLGARKRLWRTSDEKLARTLVHCGHKVALLHVS